MNHSQNNTTVIFLTFEISPVFVISLKFYHKVIPSKDADRNANSFKPDQAVSLRPVMFAQKNCKEAAGCGSDEYFNDKLSDL